MTRIAALLTLAIPAAAFASEGGGGLAHATEWVTWRDGGRIFNFLILFSAIFWLIRRFMIPALKERTRQISDSLEEAEKARMDAMKKLSDLEYKIKKLEQESAAMRSDAEREGGKIAEQMIAEAKQSAARILEKAKAEIENETVKAKDRLKRETAELSIRLARELLEKELRETDHKLIVDGYMGKLKNLQ